MSEIRSFVEQLKCRYRNSLPGRIVEKLESRARGEYLYFFILAASYLFVNTLFGNLMANDLPKDILIAKRCALSGLWFANSIRFALVLAAGTMFAAVRHDVERLRRTLRAVILPIALIVEAAALYYLMRGEKIAGLLYVESARRALFYRRLNIEALSLFLNAVCGVLTFLLIARARFGRLFAGWLVSRGVCVLVALCCKGRGALYYDLMRELVFLAVLVFLCRDVLFGRTGGGDWRTPCRLLWRALCIFAAVYFCQHCVMILSCYLRLPIAFCYYSCIGIVYFIWGGLRTEEQGDAFDFWLKTLIFSAVLAVVYHFYYRLGASYGVSAINSRLGFSAADVLVCFTVVSLFFVVKTATCAYFCRRRWYFALPVHMFLTVCGYPSFLVWTLGKFRRPELSIPDGYWIPRVGVSTALFLLLSLGIDLFAALHAKGRIEVPIRPDRNFVIICRAAAAFMLCGFYLTREALKRALIL